MTFSISTAARTAAAILSLSIAAVPLAGVSFAQQTPDPAAPPKNAFGPRAKKEAKPGQAPQVNVVATHGSWNIECEAPPAVEGVAADPAKKQQCGMVQTALSDKNKQIGVKLILIRGKQNGKDATKMRVMAPIGVYLPTGIALEIDGEAVSRVPFTLCIPSACMALADAQPKTLDRLKKGTKANFIVYLGPGSGVPVSVSLEGFAAAHTALEKM